MSVKHAVRIVIIAIIVLAVIAAIIGVKGPLGLLNDEFDGDMVKLLTSGENMIVESNTRLLDNDDISLTFNKFIVNGRECSITYSFEIHNSKYSSSDISADLFRHELLYGDAVYNYPIPATSKVDGNTIKVRFDTSYLADAHDFVVDKSDTSLLSKSNTGKYFDIMKMDKRYSNIHGRLRVTLNSSSTNEHVEYNTDSLWGGEHDSRVLFSN